jgi:hypothetical protein
MVTLDDLMRGNCGLEMLLNVPNSFAEACARPTACA